MFTIVHFPKLTDQNLVEFRSRLQFNEKKKTFIDYSKRFRELQKKYPTSERFATESYKGKPTYKMSIVDYENSGEALDEAQCLAQKAILKLSPLPRIENIADITDSRLENLKNLLDERFFSVKVLDEFTCFLETVFHGADDDVTSTAKEEIFTYLKQLTLIGKVSAAGMVFISSIKDIPNSLIVKTVKDAKNDPQASPEIIYRDIIHELFVGRKAVNFLRGLTPCFSYVLSGFMCKEPSFMDPDKRKRIKDICRTGDDAFYVAYEKIPGGSFKDIIKNVSPIPVFQQDFIRDFLSILIQLSCSLKIAWDRYRFTHYDLHTDNVMCKPIPPGKLAVEMKHPNSEIKYFYVVSRYIPIIIDYGMSHILVDGIRYGSNRIQRNANVTNDYNAIFDLYKFYCFTLYDFIFDNDERVKRSNIETFTKLLLLGKFFNIPTDYNEALNFLLRNRNDFFSSREHFHENAVFEELISLIELYYPDDWKSITGFKEPSYDSMFIGRIVPLCDEKCEEESKNLLTQVFPKSNDLCIIPKTLQDLYILENTHCKRASDEKVNLENLIVNFRNYYLQITDPEEKSFANDVAEHFGVEF